MTQANSDTLIVSKEKPQRDNFPKLPQEIGTDYTFKREIVWKNVLGFIILHLAACYGLYLAVFKAHALTLFYGKILLKKQEEDSSLKIVHFQLSSWHSFREKELL